MAIDKSGMAEAIELAEDGLEDLLCNSRLIKEICLAMGCSDPEGLAPHLDTKTLIQRMGQMIVDGVVAAGHKSPDAKAFSDLQAA